MQEVCKAFDAKFFSRLIRAFLRQVGGLPPSGCMLEKLETLLPTVSSGLFINSKPLSLRCRE